MADRWRVGLVGVGRGSGYGRLLAEDPRCEITALCDRDPDALARFQEGLGLPDDRCFTDYGRFVDSGLDIVFVGTPIPAHCEQVISALEAGCHVLSEVTMAPTIGECQQIVDAVRRTGKRYMLAENCVYWHFVNHWRELVQSGDLGIIVYAECEYMHPIPSLIYDPATGEKRWRSYRPPLHYCSHSLGPILEITGDRIVRACGVGNTHHIFDLPDPGTIDLQVALFQTEKGMTIKMLRTSLLPRDRGMHAYELHGTKGFVATSQDGVGENPGRLYIQGKTDATQEIDVPRNDPNLPPSAQAGGHGTAEYSLLQDFLGALERGEKPRLDEIRGWELTVPGIVAHDSAMNGNVWMEVPAPE
ncbi:MAG: Gfo/Idh/MocA family oxidoreductase [Armatimonadetes bacterium]|nr:Gfo/Idh/MocA family oxidoreductase [Armatimonadota bacterium]